MMAEQPQPDPEEVVISPGADEKVSLDKEVNGEKLLHLAQLLHKAKSPEEDADPSGATERRTIVWRFLKDGGSGNIEEQQFGFTLCHAAAANGWLDVLYLLGEVGANLYAETTTEYPEVSTYWWRIKAGVKRRCPKGSTPDDQAVLYGHDNCHEFLSGLPPK
eukprot:m.19039 g.19039  ORF g.19039 m.19039 type:complete len:162 (+) comp5857_c0_seq1:50-535(+)